MKVYYFYSLNKLGFLVWNSSVNIQTKRLYLANDNDNVTSGLKLNKNRTEWNQNDFRTYSITIRSQVKYIVDKISKETLHLYFR